MNQKTKQFQILFQEHDKDKDGKLEVQEFSAVLKELGLNLYGPKILKDVKKIHHYEHYEKYQIDYNQALDYYLSRKSVISSFIWNHKKEFDMWSSELISILKQKGSDLRTIKDRQLNGNIQIYANRQQSYKTEICLEIKKDSKKKISNPTIDLFIQLKQKEDCEIIKGSILQLQTMLKEMMVGQSPELQVEVNLLKMKVDTNIEAKEVSVHLESKIQEIFDCQSYFTDVFDRILENKIDGKIKLFYKTNNKLEDYLKLNEKSLLDFLTKNLMIQFEWQTGECVSALKQFALKTRILSSFQYSKASLDGLAILGFLCSQNLQGVFEYDNNFGKSEQQEETALESQLRESKLEMIQMIAGFIQSFYYGEMSELKFKDIIEKIKEKIHVKVSFGSLDIDLSIKIEGLFKIIENMASFDFDNSQDFD